MKPADALLLAMCHSRHTHQLTWYPCWLKASTADVFPFQNSTVKLIHRSWFSRQWSKRVNVTKSYIMLHVFADHMTGIRYGSQCENFRFVQYYALDDPHAPTLSFLLVGKSRCKAYMRSNWEQVSLIRRTYRQFWRGNKVFAPGLTSSSMVYLAFSNFNQILVGMEKSEGQMVVKPP